MDDPWLLPPHATLFYVGPPKTGTTAVQAAGAACREELLGHGVRYPGIGLNHRKEVNAFLGRGFGWRVAGERVASAPEMEAWTDLLARSVASSSAACGSGTNTRRPRPASRRGAGAMSWDRTFTSR